MLLKWCGLKTKNVTFSFANFSKDEMYQIIDYDTDTKITTLSHDNIGKSKLLIVNQYKHYR
jgi:hypothetical protein